MISSKDISLSRAAYSLVGGRKRGVCSPPSGFKEELSESVVWFESSTSMMRWVVFFACY